MLQRKHDFLVQTNLEWFLDPDLNHSGQKDCLIDSEPELYQGDVQRDKCKLTLQYLGNWIHISAFLSWMSKDQINLIIMFIWST